MIDVNKGQGNSFWYQVPIDFSYTTLFIYLFIMNKQITTNA